MGWNADLRRARANGKVAPLAAIRATAMELLGPTPERTLIPAPPLCFDRSCYGGARAI